MSNLLNLFLKKGSILLIFLIATSSMSIAEERQEACVKYKKDYGWSKGYSVVATVMSGLDLNAAVGSISRFEPFATYAVIFWGDDQATILKLRGPSMGNLPMIEQEVEDQDGRSWKIKQGNNFCF